MLASYKSHSAVHRNRILPNIILIGGLLTLVITISACSKDDTPQIGKRSPHTFPNLHEFGKHLLYYSDYVPAETAVRLADYLMANGWEEIENWMGRLAKRGDIYELHVVFQKDLINRRDVLNNAKKMAEYLSWRVFDSANVEIHICDEDFIVQKIVKSPQKE